MGYLTLTRQGRRKDHVARSARYRCGKLARTAATGWITIKLKAIDGSRAKIAIKAPTDLQILRSELEEQ